MYRHGLGRTLWVVAASLLLLQFAESESILCEVTGDGVLDCDGVEYKKEALDVPGTSIFYWHLAMCVGFVCFAGMMSGLTIGLLSLDYVSLQVLKNSGEPQERVYAARIIPLVWTSSQEEVAHKHLLLVTLLLCNAAAMEALPIFLDKMVPSYMAIALSVTAVLFFGEYADPSRVSWIIPQALCSRYGLAIGYYSAPMVRLLMFLCFVIAWPISKLLDAILGEESANLYARGELTELVYLHGQAREDSEERLTKDEIMIIKGAMDMAGKTVQDAMTPLEYVYAIDMDARLTRELFQEILQEGHSRIPIYQGSKENILGGMLVKQLISIDPDDNVLVRDVMKYTLQFVPQDMPLYDMLNQFQTGKSHLAVVRDSESGHVLGIITLEDVIEELINEEIVDETDVYVDVTNRVHVVRPKQDPGRKNSLLRNSGSVFAMASGRATGLSTNALTASHVDSVASQPNAAPSSPRRLLYKPAALQTHMHRVTTYPNVQVLQSPGSGSRLGRTPTSAAGSFRATESLPAADSDMLEEPPDEMTALLIPPQPVAKRPSV